MNGRIQALLEPSEQAAKAAKNARTSGSAKSAAKALKEMEEKSALYIENAKELYDAVREKYVEIEKEREAHDAAVKAQREAELAEQKRLEEEAARERERLALERQAETEKEQAKADKEAMTELFTLHDFDTIVSTLEGKLAEYQTEGGKAAFMVVLDRFKYVAGMRTILIGAINAEPFPWGWGTGTSARDVEKASLKGVSIVGSSAVYPWKAVSVRQMLKFVDHYLASRKLKATDKANLAFGAAIYCDEFGEKGRAKAKVYLNRALDSGFARSEQERLVEIGW